ncbi:MAG: EAL domain-containing protein [Burkholderiaceae bacterium]|nr:EAL domain-containing protein [Burkholderiaceae bacterium]
MRAGWRWPVATAETSAPTVLVADDDATTRLLIAATLRGAGFQVLVASDGIEAIELFDRTDPELLVLDVEMPRASGYEVCSHVRKHPDAGRRNVPVVIATGMDDTVSVNTAYECGATDFVSKPVNMPSLVHRLRYVLRSHAAMQRLLAAEDRSRAMLSAIPDAILQFDAHGVVTAYRGGQGGARLPHLANCAGSNLADLLPEVVAPLIFANSVTPATAGERKSVEFAWLLEGRWAHFEARCVPKAIGETYLFLRDISERKESEERIHRLAYCDSLTGMPNRQAFLETLEREVARATQASQMLAVLFMDLDGFKRVNDTLGHAVGDHLLQTVAARLKQVLRPRDLVARDLVPRDLEQTKLARLGGDEFTILLTDIARPEDAIAVAQRVREEIKRPFSVDSHEIVVSSSIGVSIFPDDGDGAMALVKHADTAMYHAKERGRDNCQLYSASLTTRVVQRVSREKRRRQAHERGGVGGSYQPLIGTVDRAVVGMEALLRWNDPQHGLISPAEFIPVAEESGLIIPIGEWVLRTACAQAVRWQSDAARPVRLAVNLSSVQFRDVGLVATILAILRESGLAPQLLELEVTESALMDDADAAILRMHELEAAGVRLAIDDFGTGYSSMSYLKRFPVGALKIDRSFVSGLPDDAESVAISRAIIAMAHSMKLSVTAEGIETEEQAAVLAGFGCENMQGYHFARPMNAGRATELLRESARALLRLSAA